MITRIFVWYQVDPRCSRESLRLIYNWFGIIHVLQRFPIPQTSGSNLFLSSQTDKLMAGTKFSDYLGLNHYKKAKKN